MWNLQPRAIVLSNAHLLDATTLFWLLHLRTNSYNDRPKIPRSALILIAKVTDYDAGKFAELMNKNEETKVAWPERLDFLPLSDEAFRDIIINLFADNLHARFGSDVDANKAIEQFAQWTRKNWWLITELVKQLDQALGPSPPSGEPRQVSQTVMEAVERQWLLRTR